MLSAAYLFGARPLSIIPGFGPLSVKTGSPTASVGPPGAYSAYTAIQAHQATGGPSGDMSVVLVAMRSITTGSAGLASNVQVICATTNNTGTRDGLEFAIGNAYVAPVDAITIQTYVGNVASAPNSIWLEGKKDATGAITGATALTNGQWYGVGTTVTNLAVGDGAVVFGTFDDPGTFGLTGGIAAAFFFRGVLPDDLMSELTLNPASLLTWPEDDLFYLSASSGAYTLAADPLAYEYAAGAVGLSSARRISVSPLAYNYAPQDVGLSYRQGAHTLDAEPLAYGYRPASVDLAYSGAVASAGPSRTRRGARRVYLPEPQASAVFHPNALPEDLAPHAVKAWQDDEDDEWFLLA